ncbi:MAG: hypothetical protein N2690_01875 [Rhodocyclaceae bacterium]|nr:hypothetical protein [Rhodocyclaceae bacterium]
MAEGDVFAGLVAQALPILMAVGGMIVGGVWAVIRWLGGRMLHELEERFDRMEQEHGSVMREIARIDADLKRLMAELPIHYQRREDAIREFTAMNAKLDRMWETLLEIKNGR